NWLYAGERLMNEIQIGEVHLHGDTLYFHSRRTDGKGGSDIWVTARQGEIWTDPVNLEDINGAGDEVMPFVSQDGNELWFTRSFNGSPAIFRSIRQAEGWGNPQLIISQFAG